MDSVVSQKPNLVLFTGTSHTQMGAALRAAYLAIKKGELPEPLVAIKPQLTTREKHSNPIRKLHYINGSEEIIPENTFTELQEQNALYGVHKSFDGFMYGFRKDKKLDKPLTVAVADPMQLKQIKDHYENEANVHIIALKNERAWRINRFSKLAIAALEKGQEILKGFQPEKKKDRIDIISKIKKHLLSFTPTKALQTMGHRMRFVGAPETEVRARQKFIREKVNILNEFLKNDELSFVAHTNKIQSYNNPKLNPENISAEDQAKIDKQISENFSNLTNIIRLLVPESPQKTIDAVKKAPPSETTIIYDGDQDPKPAQDSLSSEFQNELKKRSLSVKLPQLVT